MFNSPILDITIGLVFIFLLYSLLVTSINEAIATTFSLRARMLRNAIVEHMLSNIPKDSRLTSIWKGIVGFLMAVPRIIMGPEKGKGKIGDQFFEHPIIKNYGANRVFSMPSYISAKDFSAVLIDILKKDYQKKLEPIATNTKQKFSAELTKDNIQQILMNGQDVDKIHQLIEYYRAHQPSAAGEDETAAVKSNSNTSGIWLEHEVLDTLDMLLQKSNFDSVAFQKHLETWFDETMDRVSGWYKRQTQFILFCLGMTMAIIFNLDTIGITNKLSTNTDARKIIVAQAISYAEQNNTKPATTITNSSDPDSANSNSQNQDSVIKALKSQLKDIKDFKKKEIDSINTLLALGWDDYGMHERSDKFFATYFAKEPKDRCCKDLPPISENASKEEKLKWLKLYYDEHGAWLKFEHVLCQTFRWRKFMGFLIFAFAISLGAPFWFDILNKVIKLRGTGKKENGTEVEKTDVSIKGNLSPVIINNHMTDEAQG